MYEMQETGTVFTAGDASGNQLMSTIKFGRGRDVPIINTPLRWAGEPGACSPLDDPPAMRSDPFMLADDRQLLRNTVIWTSQHEQHASCFSARRSTVLGLQRYV